jgi:dTDP-4-amino-4,6-dideoxygalactose transaminase
VPGAADLDLPVTNQLSAEVVSIPVRPNLADEELDTIVAAIREVAAPNAAAPSAAAPIAAGTGA